MGQNFKLHHYRLGRGAFRIQHSGFKILDSGFRIPDSFSKLFSPKKNQEKFAGQFDLREKGVTRGLYAPGAPSVRPVPSLGAR